MKTLSIFLVTLLSFVPQSLEKQKNIDGYYEDSKYVVIRIDPNGSQIVTCYKNADGEVIGDFSRLEKHIKSTGHKLVFACNGGMFMEDLRPLGLYIENGEQIMPLNTKSASTNFYIKPNGVFYVLSNGSVGLKTTNDYILSQIKPKYATQSGGMLTVNGVINNKFKKESTSYNIRNGVGINKEGKVIFILSKEPVSFYEFAYMFQSMGCDNSLFLDGCISRLYCPEVGWSYQGGYMSVMIAVIK